MKKGFIVLSATMALMLSGCASPRQIVPGKNGQLPAGGDEVDLKNEDQKELLKEKIEGAAGAYADGIDAIGAKLSVAANADVDIEYQGKQYIVNADKLKVEAEAALRQEEDEEGTRFASGYLSLAANGKLAVNIEDFDESISLENVGLDAYINGGNFYVDYSGAGLEKLLDDASETTNHSTVIREFFNIGEQEVDLNGYVDELVGIEGRKVYLATPEFINGYLVKEYAFDFTDMIGTYVDALDALDEEAINALNELLTIVVYTDGSFGFTVKYDAEKFFGLMEQAVGQMSGAGEALEVFESLEEIYEEFDVQASVLFDSNCRLKTVSCSYKLALAEGSEMKGLTVNKFATSMAMSLSLKYGDDAEVKEDDFEEYEELQLANLLGVVGQVASLF